MNKREALDRLTADAQGSGVYDHLAEFGPTRTFAATLVRNVRFSVENNRLQHRLNAWRTDCTLGQLDELGVNGLYRIPGLGKKCVNAIVELLAEYRPCADPKHV